MHVSSVADPAAMGQLMALGSGTPETEKKAAEGDVTGQSALAKLFSNILNAFTAPLTQGPSSSPPPDSATLDSSAVTDQLADMQTDETLPEELLTSVLPGERSALPVPVSIPVQGEKAATPASDNGQSPADIAKTKASNRFESEQIARIPQVVLSVANAAKFQSAAPASNASAPAAYSASAVTNAQVDTSIQTEDGPVQSGDNAIEQMLTTDIPSIEKPVAGNHFETQLAAMVSPASVTLTPVQPAAQADPQASEGPVSLIQSGDSQNSSQQLKDALNDARLALPIPLPQPGKKADKSQHNHSTTPAQQFQQAQEAVADIPMGPIAGLTSPGPASSIGPLTTDAIAANQPAAESVTLPNASPGQTTSPESTIQNVAGQLSASLDAQVLSVSSEQVARPDLPAWQSSSQSVEFDASSVSKPLDNPVMTSEAAPSLTGTIAFNSSSTGSSSRDADRQSESDLVLPALASKSQPDSTAFDMSVQSPVDNSSPGVTTQATVSGVSSGVNSNTAVNSATDNVFNPTAQSIVNQVSDGTVQAVRTSQASVDLQLNPNDLGTVRVRLQKVGDGEIAARFIVAESEVGKALSQHIQHLTTSLEQQGIQINRLDIVVAGQATSSDMAGHQQSSQSDNRHQANEQQPAWAQDAHRGSDTAAGQSHAQQSFQSFQQAQRLMHTASAQGYASRPGGATNSSGSQSQPSAETLSNLNGNISVLA